MFFATRSFRKIGPLLHGRKMCPIHKSLLFSFCLSAPSFSFSRKLFSVGLLGWIFILVVFSGVSLAQVTTAITSDGSLGTTITPNGFVHDITGGTRPGNGPNLFHSFGQFSIGTEDIANFLNDSGLPTENILSRVTGGDPSNIFGTIQTSGFGAANLFLLNPAGVVFGPTSSLNVGGSFFTSTADFIRLGEDGVFNADLNEESVLTVAPPEAFGFLSSNPASIAIEGAQLGIPSSSTFTVLAGDIGIGREGGTIMTGGGQVNIMSVASAGEVLLTTAPDGALDINVDSIEKLGTISFGGTVAIDTTGVIGGNIVIRGGNLLLEPGAVIDTNNLGDSDAGRVELVATENILFQNQSSLLAGAFGDGDTSQVALSAPIIEINGGQIATVLGETNSDADGGNIELRGKQIFFTDGGIIEATGLGNGDGSTVKFEAEEIVFQGTDESGNPSGIFGGSNGTGMGSRVQLVAEESVIINGGALEAHTGMVGNGGNIEISSRDVRISGGGGIFNGSLGSGRSGVVNISAFDTVSLDDGIIGAPAFGDGDAGSVNVLTGQLTFMDGSLIDTSTKGSGSGGNVAFVASDVLEIVGAGPIGEATRIDSSSSGGGPGGNIVFSAPTVNLTDGILLTGVSNGSGRSGNIAILADQQANLTNGAQIDVSSVGSGEGGAVVIEGEEVLLAGSGTGVFSRASGRGNGGDITIEGNSLILTDEAMISAESSGTGNAGDISLKAGDTIRLDNSTITSQATKAFGGNITLTAKELIQLNDSQVRTRVQEGSGSAGSITFDPDFIVIRNSDVLSTAVFGDGGPISMVANDAILIDSFSNVDASSQFGGSGTINIQAPIKFLSGAIVPLESQPVEVATLYSARCAAGAGGNFSTFVNSKTDSLPPIPGTFLTSPLLGPSAQTVPDSSTQSKNPAILTASIAPLVLGHANESTTACP